MAGPTIFHSLRTTRSDCSDSYYDGRAYYQYTNTSYGRRCTHDSRRNDIDENDVHRRLGKASHPLVQPDYCTTAQQRDSQIFQFPQVGQDAGIKECDEQNRRIAEWVETQQVSEHITLPLHSFESMIDRLIAAEEALEKLKAAAFSCVKEAHSVWRRPEDARHGQPMHASGTICRQEDILEPCSIDAARSGFVACGNDTSASAWNKQPLPRTCCDDDAGQVPVVGNDEKNLKMRTHSERRLDSARAIERQGPSTPSSRPYGSETKDGAAKQISDATSKAVTLHTSWLDNDSSQSSCQSHTSQRLSKPQIRIVPSSPGVMEYKEGDTDRHVKPPQSLAASLHSVQDGVQNDPSSTAAPKADKMGPASRVEARLRNSVDKFLLKMRPSRNSAPSETPSGRSPLNVSPEDLNAYLTLPTDVLPSAGPIKMIPRSPINYGGQRVLTSRRSAPLLRGG